MNIIGIAGTNGSGKDTVGKILEKEHGFLFVSVTDILRDELNRQRKQIMRENMRALGDSWRRELGLGVLVDKAIEIYNSRSDQYSGLAIASIRNLGEVEYIHKLSGVLVWVDADPEIRYKRISGRGRSAEDSKTYQEFLKEEQDEMQSADDETSLAMAEVKKLCDIFIENNTDDKELFTSTIEHALRAHL